MPGSSWRRARIARSSRSSPERNCQICTRPRGHLDPGFERSIAIASITVLDEARYKVLNDAHAKGCPRLDRHRRPDGLRRCAKGMSSAWTGKPCPEGGEVQAAPRALEQLMSPGRAPAK